MAKQKQKQKQTRRFTIDTKMLLLYALFLIFPLFIHQLLFWLNGYGVKMFHILPVMNDEVSWWSQINAMLTSGNPLGYYGYNGTHAPVGTSGPWGIAPLLPYVLYGKIFGWHLHSMAYANILFLSVSVFVFCLLAKPDKKQLKWIFIVYACSFLTIGYSLTAMSEGMRYAVGVVLIGIVVWLRENAPEIRKLSVKFIIIYLVIIAVLVYSINVYLIFALASMLIAWFMLKGMKPWLRALLSILFTLICALVSFKMTARYIAPYTVSTINTLLEVLRDQGGYKAFCALFNGTLKNLLSVGIFNTIHQDTEIVQLFVITYNAVLVLTTVFFVRHLFIKKRQKASGSLFVEMFSGNSFLVIFLLLGFVVGYAALYTGSYWTLCRGINTGLLMAFLLIAMGEWKAEADPRNFNLIRVIVLAMSVFSIATIWSYLQSNVIERYESMERIPVIEAEKAALGEVFEIGPDKDAWDNTIAHYGEIDNFYLALPDAAGINSLSDEVLNTEARYVIYRTSVWPEYHEKYEEMLKESGHGRIYEDDLFIVYERGVEDKIKVPERDKDKEDEAEAEDSK